MRKRFFVALLLRMTKMEVMIISRTPLRISFVGGGSDLPAFYEREPGAVVSAAINKYIYITVNKKFDHKIRASYSKTEIVDGVDNLNHELIREGLKLVGLTKGIEVTSIADIHSRGTGLGSSSTYTVGLLHALYAYKGEFVPAERLTREACEIEIDRCGKPIGKQDQYAAAFGDLNYLQFNPDESVFVDPLICARDFKKRLSQRLLMLYTGIERQSSDILKEQNEEMKSNDKKRKVLRKMVQLARDLRVELNKGQLDAFGEILHENWMLKKQLASKISNSQIDYWYEIGRKNGALGGKVLGAGGGGFLLFYTPLDNHGAIIKALPELRHVPIEFDTQGSKIIFAGG